jgi:Flp pilus assembly protein TadD
MAELYSRLIELTPDEQQPYDFHNRGHIHFHFAQYEAAVADFGRYLKSSPDDLHLLLSRAEALGRLNRCDESARDYLRVFELQPHNATAHNDLAWRLAQRAGSNQQLDLALTSAQKAVELQPVSADFHNTLGVVYYRLGRYQDAVNSLRQSISLHGDGGGPHDWFFLAASYHRIE